VIMYGYLFILAECFEVLNMYFFFFPAEDGIRGRDVTGVQTCALPISTKVWNATAPLGRRWFVTYLIQIA